MTLMTIPAAEQRVLLHDISWETYQSLLRDIGDGHVRLTYDSGVLEIMSPSNFHEHVKTILGRLIEAYADAIETDIEGRGSTTFSRKDLKKGLEPDECYYVQHARDVAGQEDPDLAAHPPDLAIEVDISPPRIGRQPIYAALGVAEIWRYNGREIECLHRVADAHGARYIRSERSLAFPDLPMSELARFLEIGLTQSQSAAVRALRTWLRA